MTEGMCRFDLGYFQSPQDSTSALYLDLTDLCAQDNSFEERTLYYIGNKNHLYEAAQHEHNPAVTPGYLLETFTITR